MSGREREDAVHLYVGGERKEAYAGVQEALDALEEIAPLSAETKAKMAEGKRYPAPDYDVTPAVIHIAPGVYREKIVVGRPKVTLSGDGAEGAEKAGLDGAEAVAGERSGAVLVYGQGAFEEAEDGTRRGTFRTASVRIDAPDFTARGITFQNDAGYGHTVGQALALYVDADRCIFENCRILGSQDTLFTAPLPLKEAKPGGFRGPGEFLPRILGRHYYKNCFIQGDVDFIFGGGICLFEGCVLFSKFPEDRLAERQDAEAKEQSGEAPQPVYGYVTAASTPQGQLYGYVLKNCRLLSDCPAGSVYLGRPWREHAKTVFLNCEMGAHIHPLGWKDWDKDHSLFFYGEYGSYGPGAAPDQRADFSHQLTRGEAELYSRSNVLAGWEPDC